MNKDELSLLNKFLSLSHMLQNKCSHTWHMTHTYSSTVIGEKHRLFLNTTKEVTALQLA